MGQLTTSSVRVTSCDDGWVSTVDARSWRELFPIEWWLGFRRKMATNTRSLTLSVSAQYRIKLAKPWELSPTPWKKNHQAVRHYLGVKWRQPYCFHYIYYILGLLTNSTLYMTSYSTVCNSLIFLCHLFPMLICLIQKIHQLHILYSNICCCGAICLGTRRTYLNLRPGTKFSTKLHYNRLI